MRATRYFAAVDSHTEGMPTRVITGGLGPVPGATMQERRLYFERHLDDLRLLLMREPRGHSAMSGAFLQPPTRPDADWGVLFVEVSGLLPMCGHGTIGVATVLVETGMVEVTEPETRIRLDTPAGLVEATVTVSGGRAERVTLRNVPAFVTALDAQIEVGALGGAVRYDMAFGGNFYALVPAASVGLDPSPANADELIARGLAIAAAINASAEPVHPVDAAIRGCKHVVFHAPGRNGAHARNATAIHPGWLDRSPCGTGTSARMAALHARGELALGEEFVNESVIGSRFSGRLVEEVTLGTTPAVVPEVSGRAWITGMGQYLLDPTDPFPTGFDL
ncbi:MAG TPA: proline racemase family protein [Solirubrobacteraceae bacterium]|nr:proline racemase family protein [Solirubrobacteraceae bacterium]